MRTHVQHTLKHDNVTVCGIPLTNTSSWYWHRSGCPAPIRDWLVPCKRCAAIAGRPVSPKGGVS